MLARVMVETQEINSKNYYKIISDLYSNEKSHPFIIIKV